MTSAGNREFDGGEPAFEDVSPGLNASGFGHLGDGRSFAFQVQRQTLSVQLYRPRLAGPVPQDDDVVATASRSTVDIDVTDERSLVAAVRDTIAVAQRPR